MSIIFFCILLSRCDIILNLNSGMKFWTMDSSETGVKEEIKDETLELFDVPIKTETKSILKFEVKIKIKEELGLQIGLGITDKLDLPVKKDIQDDFNPDNKVKEELR